MVSLNNRLESILNFTSSFFPSCQILLMDGRIAAGLVDNLLPSIPSRKFYQTRLRPTICFFLKVNFLPSIVVYSDL